MQKETWHEFTGIADPLFRIILLYCILYNVILLYGYTVILSYCQISLGFHTTAHSYYTTATPCWLLQQHLHARTRSAIERGWTVPLVPDITPCGTSPSGRVSAIPQRMTAPEVTQPTIPAIGLCSSPDLIDSPPIAPTHVPSTTSPTTHRHYHIIV